MAPPLPLAAAGATWLRRNTRAAALELRVAWKFARLGRPRVALHFGIGFGDDLLCTALAHELHARGERHLWMLSDHPELFENNRDVAAVMPRNDETRFMLGRAQARIVEPFYCQRDFATDHDTPPTRHILTEMCAAAGLTGRVALRPYLHLSAAERRFGRFSEKQIAIHSSGGSAYHTMRNKEWFPERFAQVVELLRGEFDFVQIGSANDPLLPGVRDLRGQTTPRQTAAVMANSRFFVGLVGFLMHLARAVECRGVIVYGGREAPWQSGYPCNVNLATTGLACAPCWRWSTCDYDRVCMSGIAPEAVAEAIRAAAGEPAQPLEIEYADLT